MYIKIIGYFIFLLQFVRGFSHIDWTKGKDKEVHSSKKNLKIP
jgi:hypothetical protein